MVTSEGEIAICHLSLLLSPPPEAEVCPFINPFCLYHDLCNHMGHRKYHDVCWEHAGFFKDNKKGFKGVVFFLFHLSQTTDYLM